MLSAFSHAASSWSVPITFTSCIVRADIAAPGWRTICSCTTVSTRVGASSAAIPGSRMSASISSVRFSRARGGRVSRPTTCSTSSSASSRRASSVPK